MQIDGHSLLIYNKCSILATKKKKKNHMYHWNMPRGSRDNPSPSWPSLGEKVVLRIMISTFSVCLPPHNSHLQNDTSKWPPGVST